MNPKWSVGDDICHGRERLMICQVSGESYFVYDFRSGKNREVRIIDVDNYPFRLVETGGVS